MLSILSSIPAPKNDAQDTNVKENFSHVARRYRQHETLREEFPEGLMIRMMRIARVRCEMNWVDALSKEKKASGRLITVMIDLIGNTEDMEYAAVKGRMNSHAGRGHMCFEMPMGLNGAQIMVSEAYNPESGVRQHVSPSRA